MAAKRAPLLMRPMTAVVLAALAGASFVLALWLGAYGGDLTRDRDPGPHALSHSAIGYAGLVELLKLEGAPPRLTTTAASGPASGLLILTVGPASDPATLKRLMSKGRVLIVLPKWAALPDPAHVGWVRGASPDGLASFRTLQAMDVKGVAMNEEHQSFWTLSWRPAGAGLSASPPDRQTQNIDNFQTLVGKALLPLLVDNKNRPVLVRLPGREVYVLSEPDLLNNSGLATLDGAHIATDMVTTLAKGGPVTFDLSLSVPGYGRNALKLLFEPPLASVSLCLVFAALLAAVQAFFRFGPVAREPRGLDFSKASLVESAAQLLAAAKREPRIAPQYLELVAGLTARSIGLPPSFDAPQRNAELDRLSVLRETTPLSRLAAEGRGIKTRSALMAWAHQVYQWSEEMTRGRR